MHALRKGRGAYANGCAAAGGRLRDTAADILHAMSIIPLTVFCSLLLVATFAVLFAREQRRRRFASAERDSLLPLADEQPRLAAGSRRGGALAGHGHDHDHDHDHAAGRSCGCQRGEHAPCAGCTRRAADAAAGSGADDDLYF